MDDMYPATVPAVERLQGNPLRSRVYARIGLLGNPSDGYGGKVLSLSLANFWADVTLTPLPTSSIEFQPNPESDPNQFSNIESFQSHIEGYGYEGGLRLLKAMVLRFLQHCREKEISLDTSRGFSLAYTTTIPRQCGLSGSSAIACGALNCLMEHYGVADLIPVHLRPNLILEAESVLGITAGLQDRIIQVYGGLVFMDFDCRGLPDCTSINQGFLPQLHLIYDEVPTGKDSGTVHSAFKEKYAQGNPIVKEQMAELAELADRGTFHLLNREPFRIADLMRRNFELRRQLFGDEAVGKANLRMVEIANSVGAAAKLSGSGGAVVAYCPDGEQQIEQLKEACASANLKCVAVEIGPVHHITK